MSKLNIISKEEYAKMCAEFESAKMYDGRGKEDIYECEDCDHILYSVYKDKGATPFAIKCEICGGIMTHTRTLPTILFPAKIEWYRPSYEEYENLSPALQFHVDNGGLLKKINKKQYG